MSEDDRRMNAILAAAAPLQGDDTPKRYYEIVDLRTGTVVWGGWDFKEGFVRNKIWLSPASGGLGIPADERTFYTVCHRNTRLRVCP